MCLSFHFTESRDEPTCSRRPRSSTKQYQNLQDHRYNYSCLFRFLSSSSCLRHTGPTGGKPDRLLVWVHRMVRHLYYFSSAVNPFIYYYRTNRFRSALKQFLKDPFGKTDFKEKPKYRTREKKTDAVKNGGQENQRENETRISEEYHGERRKGLTIVSIQALQSHLCDHEQSGNTGIENQLQKRNNFAFISAGGGENSALRREVQRKEEEKDVSNEVTLRRRSDGDIISKRKVFFTKGQVHPLSKSCHNIGTKRSRFQKHGSVH